MSRKTLTYLAVLLLAAAAVAGCAQMKPTAREASLYQRLGGYDAVAAVVDDFMARMAADPQLKRFFEGADPAGLRRTRQLIVDFVCNATGGPCFYTGRSMKATHAGMGIAESDWKAAAGHLRATLAKFKVPAKEAGEVMALVGSLKKDIVESS